MDQRQSNTSRRFSILKPPKTRTPLGDVDINPPIPDETTFMRSRRVSFASNNFIKEFTTDPEKNTIWHVSYEEANRSDHSAPQTSSDNNDDDASDEFNCTKFGEFGPDSPLDNSSNNFISTGDCPVVFEDTNIIRQTVNYTQDNMDLTTNYLNIQEINSKKSTEEIVIVNPGTVHVPNRQIIHFAQESNSGLIEMRETITGFNENLGTRRETILFNDDETIGGDMEITESLTNYINPVNNAMVNQPVYSFSNLNNRNIEATKTIHGFVNFANKNHLHSERQPVHFPQGSSEAQMHQMIPNSNRKPIHYNQVSHPDDLEMTESIPTPIIRSKTKLTHCDIKRDTFNVPQINVVQNKCVNSINMQSLKRQTFHFNYESNRASMDMMYGGPGQNKSIHTDVSNAKGQTIHFNQESSPDYMDMTLAIPDEDKSIHIEVSNSKRHTIHFNQESNTGTMDITKIMPDPVQVASNQSVIRYSQKLKQETLKSNNEEFCMGDMEFTQAIPTNNIQTNIPSTINNENNPRTKHQTVIYNQESDMRDMEFTQVISKDDLILNIKQQTDNYNKNTRLTHCEDIKLNQTSDSGNKPHIGAPQKIKSQPNLLDSTLFTSEPLMSSTRLENNLSTSYSLKHNPNVVPYISNNQDICQRNNCTGESFDMCKMLFEKLNLTQAPSNLSHKSVNTISISTDNTEKLINFQIQVKPMSEYSKIINDDVNLPSLLCMTTGNCTNVPENDSKLNETEFHSLENKLIPDRSNEDRNKFQDENCVRNVNTINNSARENVEIKSMIDDQIVNKGQLIKSADSATNKNVNTSKSDSFILVDSSSDDGSCYEVDVSNNVMKDEVNNSESTFNEILEKNYTLPANYSEDIISKRAIVKQLLDSLNVPHKKHEKAPTTKTENAFPSKKKTKVDMLRERFETIKNKKPNIIENILVKTLEDKIKDKSVDALWSIVSMNNNEFQFFFMYETIKCIINIDRDSEIVENVAIFSQFCKSTSHPSAIYVHSILAKELSQAQLRSVFAGKYTILSFLDYLTIIGEQMIDIFHEFEELALQHALIIDMKMNATYKAVNSYLRIAFDVTFNLSDLDHITEECLSIKEILGTVRQTELKKLVRGCPQGIDFIRIFIVTVDEYLKKLEQAKKSRQCIQSVG